MAGAECCVEPDQTKYRTKSSNSWSLPHKALFTRYQIKLILTIPSSANKWISCHPWGWEASLRSSLFIMCLSQVLLRMVLTYFKQKLMETHFVENFVVTWHSENYSWSFHEGNVPKKCKCISSLHNCPEA